MSDRANVYGWGAPATSVGEFSWWKTRSQDCQDLWMFDVHSIYDLWYVYSIYMIYMYVHILGVIIHEVADRKTWGPEQKKIWSPDRTGFWFWIGESYLKTTKHFSLLQFTVTHTLNQDPKIGGNFFLFFALRSPHHQTTSNQIIKINLKYLFRHQTLTIFTCWKEFFCPSVGSKVGGDGHGPTQTRSPGTGLDSHRWGHQRHEVKVNLCEIVINFT